MIWQAAHHRNATRSWQIMWNSRAGEISGTVDLGVKGDSLKITRWTHTDAEDMVTSWLSQSPEQRRSQQFALEDTGAADPLTR